MKKLILQTFLFLFVSSFAYGQTTSGSVRYHVSLDFSSAPEKLEQPNVNKDDQSEVKKPFRSADDYFIELKFNKDVSISQKEIDMESDNTPKLSLTKITSGGEHIVFNNFKENQVLLKRSNLDTILIKQTPWFWELFDETKIIGGKLCYKATTIRQVENSMSISNDTIIAWYSKEIPLPFGPYIYCGLPGLILEITSNKGLITFRATQIVIGKIKEIDIDFPEGIIISQEEAARISMLKYSKSIRN